MKRTVCVPIDEKTMKQLEKTMKETGVPIEKQIEEKINAAYTTKK